MTSEFKAVGAYIFAGGFTRGILNAGFDVLCHLEDGTYGVPTAVLNFPELPIETNSVEWERLIRGKRNKIDLVYGNPPCAAWSALNGKRTKSELSWQHDPRVNCTRKHFSLIKELKPKIWVWESVDRAFTTGRLFIEELTVEALSLGYAVTHLRFDAQYVGGKHRRSRYFFIAHKVKFNWEGWVKFTTASPAGKVLRGAPRRTADDRKFIPLPRYKLKAYKAARPGESLQSAWDKINPEHKRVYRTASTGRRFIVGRPPFNNVKLNADKVSPTIIGLTQIHPTEARHLTIGEMKALCGYPRDWQIQEMNGGGRWDLFTRAVMPPIGEWIGKLASQALTDNRRVKREAQVVDLRKANVKIEKFELESGG